MFRTRPALGVMPLYPLLPPAPPSAPVPRVSFSRKKAIPSAPPEPVTSWKRNDALNGPTATLLLKIALFASLPTAVVTRRAPPVTTGRSTVALLNVTVPLVWPVLAVGVKSGPNPLSVGVRAVLTTSVPPVPLPRVTLRPPIAEPEVLAATWSVPPPLTVKLVPLPSVLLVLVRASVPAVTVHGPPPPPLSLTRAAIVLTPLELWLTEPNGIRS